MIAERRCATPNCGRSTEWPHGQGVKASLCRECTSHFMRTGALPVIAPKPAWLERLTARDETGAVLIR